MDLSPLQIMIGTIGYLLSILGVAKIVQMQLERRYKLSDAKADLRETNQTQQIVHDTQFRESLILRLEKLEGKHERMQELLLLQSVENKGLTVENEYLKTTNQQQAKKLDSLQIENNEQKRQIINLEKNFAVIKNELNFTTQQVHLLMSQLASVQKDYAVEFEKEVLRRLGSLPADDQCQVLIIDDDRATLDLLKTCLKLENINACVFTEGKEALEWVRHNTPSVIIIDLALNRDLDGLTLIEKIRGFERRNEKPSSRIIIYTGYDYNGGVKADTERFNIEAVMTKGETTAQELVEYVSGLLKASPARPGRPVIETDDVIKVQLVEPPIQAEDVK